MHLLYLAILCTTITALPTSISNVTAATLRSSRGSKNGTKPILRAIPKRKCGHSPPGAVLIQTHQAIRTSLQGRAPVNPVQYTVDTAFHVVTTQDQKGSVTRAMVSKQLDVLNAAYAPSNISFRLLSVDYTTNDSWATNDQGSDMKAALRKGGYDVLNLYFQSNLSTVYDGQSSKLLGFCTLPTNITYIPCDGCPPVEFSKENYAQDGCNIHAGSMPGNYLQYYNQGKTAVHEVGHWFGLLHTFQGDSCDPNNENDMIDDTPQQAAETDGCPIGKKSCPDCPGLDPIHNYMDYSNDACYESFTPEQTHRMSEVYRTMRLGY